jgi:hypothetical protein
VFCGRNFGPLATLCTENIYQCVNILTIISWMKYVTDEKNNKWSHKNYYRSKERKRSTVFFKNYNAQPIFIKIALADKNK